jgi:hypothetical protein
VSKEPLTTQREAFAAFEPRWSATNTLALLLDASRAAAHVVPHLALPWLHWLETASPAVQAVSNRTDRLAAGVQLQLPTCAPPLRAAATQCQCRSPVGRKRGCHGHMLPSRAGRTFLNGAAALRANALGEGAGGRRGRSAIQPRSAPAEYFASHEFRVKFGAQFGPDPALRNPLLLPRVRFHIQTRRSLGWVS